MRVFIVLSIFILFVKILFSAENNKIQLSEYEKIISTSKSANYAALITYIRSKNVHNLYVYNSSGEIIHSFKDINRIIFLAEIIENKTLIYILKGDIDERWVKSKDKITSMDIKTGKENWSVNSLSDSYELSKDKKFILTNETWFTVRGDLEVISTKDGSKIIRKKIKPPYYATWYDNQRVVIISNEIIHKKNKEYDKYKEIENKRRKLVNYRKINEIKFNRGDIKKAEYNKIQKYLDKQIDSLKSILYPKLEPATPLKEKTEEKRTIGRRVRPNKKPRKYKITVTPAKLRIYNILTDTFEKEKTFVDSDGSPVFCDAIDLYGGFIDVDSDRNILFYGNKHKKEKYDMYIFKINANFEMEKDYHINHPARITKISYDKNFYYGIKSNNSGFYLLDTNLSKYSKTEIIEKGLLPKHVNLDYISFEQVLTIDKNIWINRNNIELFFDTAKGK